MSSIDGHLDCFCILTVEVHLFLMKRDVLFRGSAGSCDVFTFGPECEINNSFLADICKLGSQELFVLLLLAYNFCHLGGILTHRRALTPATPTWEREDSYLDREHKDVICVEDRKDEKGLCQLSPQNSCGPYSDYHWCKKWTTDT